MRVGCVLLVVAGACGRIAFDARAVAPDASVDVAGDAGATCTSFAAKVVANGTLGFSG